MAHILQFVQSFESFVAKVLLSLALRGLEVAPCFCFHVLLLKHATATGFGISVEAYAESANGNAIDIGT